MPLINSLSRSFPATLAFNNIKVASDLDTITHFDKESRDLDRAEINEENVARIWSATQDFFRAGAHPALTISIRRRGEHILNRAIGHAQGGLGSSNAQLATTHTPFCLFSSSKAIAALLVHKLVELDQIDLNAPLSFYIPEFAAHGKNKITVEDLLRHKAGVPSITLEDPHDLYNHDLVIEKLCNTKLSFFKKTRQAYHPISGGHLIAELVKRASGEPIEALHDRYFRHPLGMKYFSYGLAPEYEPIAAHNHPTGMKPLFGTYQFISSVLGHDFNEIVSKSNTPEFQEATIPAGNMYATAEECSRFYQMILNGGRYNDKQVLEQTTIDRASMAPRRATYDLTLKLPVRFTSAFMMGGAPMHLFGGDAPNAFGHLGMLNIFNWCDPERQLSASILTSGKQLLGPHLVPLVSLMSTITGQCGRIR